MSHNERPTERLFLEHEEDGIDKFDVLDIVVDHVVQDHSLCRSIISASPSSSTDRTTPTRAECGKQCERLTGVKAA